LDIIPEEIIIAYNMHDIVEPDRWVYIEIRKGLYGLPQYNDYPPRGTIIANKGTLKPEAFTSSCLAEHSLTNWLG
jgi:hypothetical protein